MADTHYLPPAAPGRITVQISQIRERPEATSATLPPQTQARHSTSAEAARTKPILTVRDDSPPRPEDFLVPEQSAATDSSESKAPPRLPVPQPEPSRTEPRQTEIGQSTPVTSEAPSPEPNTDPPEKRQRPIEQSAKQETVIQPEQKKPAEEVAAPVIEQPARHNEDVTATASPLASAGTDATSRSSSNTGSNSSNDDGDSTAAHKIDSNEAWRSYGQSLYALVSRNKVYPPIAIRRHLEGVVMVNVRFYKGQLMDISVKQPGSGHAVLDKAARGMLEKAVQALPVPGDLSNKSFNVVVPVSFRLED